MTLAFIITIELAALTAWALLSEEGQRRLKRRKQCKKDR